MKQKPAKRSKKQMRPEAPATRNRADVYPENEFGEMNIPSEALTEDMLPAGERPLWSDIVVFALKFDGYTYAGSSEKCAKIANRAAADFRKNKALPDSLDTLRTCLFFEQRRWHHFGQSPDRPALVYVRAILKKMRRLIRKTAKRAATQQVILKVGDADTWVTVLGWRTKSSPWTYEIEVNQVAMLEYLAEDERPVSGIERHPTKSWDAVVRWLGSEGWWQMLPLSVHPDFRQRAWLAAVEHGRNLQAFEVNFWLKALSQWSRLCFDEEELDAEAVYGY